MITCLVLYDCKGLKTKQVEQTCKRIAIDVKTNPITFSEYLKVFNWVWKVSSYNCKTTIWQSNIFQGWSFTVKILKDTCTKIVLIVTVVFASIFFHLWFQSHFSLTNSNILLHGWNTTLRYAAFCLLLIARCQVLLTFNMSYYKEIFKVLFSVPTWKLHRFL